MEYKEYYNEKGTLGAIKSIHAFIDILGAKEMNKLSTEKKIELLTLFEEHKIKAKSDLQVLSRSYSDNISYFLPLDPSFDQAARIFEVIISAHYLQRNAIQDGILIRGGISIGDLIVGETYIFGDALEESCP